MPPSSLFSKLRRLQGRARMLIIFAFALTALVLNFNSRSIYAAVGQQNDDVVVGGFVSECMLRIRARPEKRIPPTNNWDTILDITILNTSNQTLYTTQIETDNSGYGEEETCTKGYIPLPGVFNFRLHGASHLSRMFSGESAFQENGSILDVTTGGRLLMAGETSRSFNNFINILDISNQLTKLYTNDYFSDLNQDGIVNSLDLSITAYNFYQSGT